MSPYFWPAGTEKGRKWDPEADVEPCFWLVDHKQDGKRPSSYAELSGGFSVDA